jgi:hypothetical protein
MGKELTIVIAGKPASGKTTIAEEMFSWLGDLGLRVILEDDRDTPEASPELHEKRLEALREAELTITVRTAPLQRSGKLEPPKQLYATFGRTNLGKCVVVTASEGKKEAEKKVADYLIGEDISFLEVTKVEQIDPNKGPCIFWDNELEQGEEGPA